MEYIGNCLIVLVKFLHQDKILDFSSDDAIGDNIPHVFLS